MSSETDLKLVKKMFEKQDELNIHTNGEDWKNNKNLKWYRAVWTECAELIDYTNWKWWKKQDIKIKDIEMELIDIWHFGMSDMMTHTNINHCSINVVYKFEDAFKEFDKHIPYDIDSIQTFTELLAYSSLRSTMFILQDFVVLCSSLNMNIETIYKLYMGKNILNGFRQDNGYKEKKYIKIWNDQEDNFYLMKFLDETDITDESFEKTIYNKLYSEYQIMKLDLEN